MNKTGLEKQCSRWDKCRWDNVGRCGQVETKGPFPYSMTMNKLLIAFGTWQCWWQEFAVSQWPAEGALGTGLVLTHANYIAGDLASPFDSGTMYTRTVRQSRYGEEKISGCWHQEVGPHLGNSDLFSVDSYSRCLWITCCRLASALFPGIDCLQGCGNYTFTQIENQTHYMALDHTFNKSRSCWRQQFL